jgi:hypothetical protein
MTLTLMSTLRMRRPTGAVGPAPFESKCCAAPCNSGVPPCTKDGSKRPQCAVSTTLPIDCASALAARRTAAHSRATHSVGG